MIKRSTLLHLRIPFSLYLLPFFLFALSQCKNLHIFNTILSAVIIHIIFYPASNGFNSYFDKDEESIGGLKNPPKVDKELYLTALVLDSLALLLSLLINIPFTIMIFIIGLASKAYSHPSIRLKKHPFFGLLTVAFFQGTFTYAMSIIAIEDTGWDTLTDLKVIFPAFLCSLILFGSYPMTQIYQHREDLKRGDRTISLILGIRGTFIWTTVNLTSAIIGFYFFLNQLYPQYIFCLLITCLLPVLAFFIHWLYTTWSLPETANFDKTMKLNHYSSLGFIVFFISLFLFRLFNHELRIFP